LYGFRLWTIGFRQSIEGTALEAVAYREASGKSVLKPKA
jgi:hypothetical protein